MSPKSSSPVNDGLHQQTSPTSPTHVPAPGWKYTGRKALREFFKDQCMDLAAGLTYYAVLAIFPALIAVFSLLGVVGQGQNTVTVIMPILQDVLGAAGTANLEPVIQSLATAPGAGLTLVLGLLTALWSASGFVTALSRAMNRVYEIPEGRPIWKLRPIMLVITLGLIVLAVLVALMLVLSGPVATALGEALGLGTMVMAIWSIAKWPVILAIVIVIVAMLYHFTPNVQQPKFRWVGVGAIIAIVVWIVASVAFGFYITNFSNYASTYGALAGVIIFFLWLWITNLALLFGAQVDAELERTRELLVGIPAEEDIQLPARDHTKVVKDLRKEREDIDKGRAIRQSSGATDQPPEHGA